MHTKRSRVAQAVTVAVVAYVTITAAAWGGPPMPPVTSTPSTPLGGPEAALAVAAGIAMYGMWRSRR
ncbi:hypothetical protein LPW11_05910 [Geomonas sp. RF6]|uniref:hypothetical protein n=1 Tax=Geomonas sp. RF6 TaxID=2897342 RepID=UPI001E2C7D0A|nr:hypothetical protein [Geomonas sp. RF6]UFS71726.1 hypothetical protein LPW11_05910 [Geomonas sp. RF6]